MWFIAGKLLLPRWKKKLTWSAEVVTKHMQVDRMFRADAAITIKQNKTKTERGGHPHNKKGDRALSYNGAKTATHKYSFNCMLLKKLVSISVWKKTWNSCNEWRMSINDDQQVESFNEMKVQSL